MDSQGCQPERAHPLAPFNLGYMYYKGWGVPKDYTEAAALRHMAQLRSTRPKATRTARKKGPR